MQIPSNWAWGFAHGPWYGQEYLLLTGFQNPSLDLGVFGIPAVLFTSTELWSLSGSGSATNTVSLAVPLDPGLVGVSFYQQVVEFSYSGVASWPSFPSAFYITGLSRGGHGVIGT